MLSDLEINDKIYSLLNIPAVTSVITGSVWKIKRPLNSTLEDIVINCLPTNNLQVQTAISNVNIHVANFVTETNGAEESVINYPRLRELTNLIIPLLKNKYFENYWIDVQQQHTFQDDVTENYYSNLRIEFYFINI